MMNVKSLKIKGWEEKWTEERIIDSKSRKKTSSKLNIHNGTSHNPKWKSTSVCHLIIFFNDHQF